MNINSVARIGNLVGEPARCAMLVELMDGRALTAGELARVAHISAQTASRPLAQMVDAGLHEQQSQGRHRYHRAPPGCGRPAPPAPSPPWSGRRVAAR
jgi:DNA-binding transcriptional ArsR family regulator